MPDTRPFGCLLGFRLLGIEMCKPTLSRSFAEPSRDPDHNGPRGDREAVISRRLRSGQLRCVARSCHFCRTSAFSGPRDACNGTAVLGLKGLVARPSCAVQALACKLSQLQLKMSDPP